MMPHTPSYSSGASSTPCPPRAPSAAESGERPPPWAYGSPVPGNRRQRSIRLPVSLPATPRPHSRAVPLPATAFPRAETPRAVQPRPAGGAFDLSVWQPCGDNLWRQRPEGHQPQTHCGDTWIPSTCLEAGGRRLSSEVGPRGAAQLSSEEEQSRGSSVRWSPAKPSFASRPPTDDTEASSAANVASAAAAAAMAFVNGGYLGGGGQPLGPARCVTPGRSAPLQSSPSARARSGMSASPACGEQPPGASSVLRQISAPAWQVPSAPVVWFPSGGSCTPRPAQYGQAAECSGHTGAPLMSHVGNGPSARASPPTPPPVLLPAAPAPDLLLSPHTEGKARRALSGTPLSPGSGRMVRVASSGSLQRTSSVGPAALHQRSQSPLQRSPSRLASFASRQVKRLSSAPSFGGAAADLNPGSSLRCNAAHRQVSAPHSIPQSSKRSPLELDVLDVENLQFEGSSCDPTVEPLRSRILTRLEPLGVVASSCQIEFLENGGGFNEGTWFLNGNSRQGTLVLKLVKTNRRHPMLPTDVENFKAIIQRHPNIINDHALSFAIKIFHCVGPGENWSHDLIVMRKAPGHGFNATVCTKCALGQVESLMKDMESLGCLLAQVHSVYGMQHGDLQPSNIFHDEANGWFTLVDCGGMGPNPYAHDDDLQHLIEGIALITQHMGEEFQGDVKRHLEASYSQEAHVQQGKRESDGGG